MEQYTGSFKKGIAIALWGLLAVLVVPQIASAADSTTIDNTVLGSGAEFDGAVAVTPVMDGMYFAPQYMPGYPTAAPIFPRVIDVNCTQGDKVLKCEGYNWAPAMGRGEYLFVRPHMVKELTPAAPVVIFKEVPVKKGKE